jgi:hypothetical protein
MATNQKKKNSDMQAQVMGLIDWDDFRKSLQEIVEPSQRVQAYMGLLPYVLPKLQSVQQDITTKQKDAVGQLLETLSTIPKEN